MEYTTFQNQIAKVEFRRISSTSRWVRPVISLDNDEHVRKLETRHLVKTLRSLTRAPTLSRKDPKSDEWIKVKNPVFISQLYGFVSKHACRNFEAFEIWSRDNGFSLNSELILHSPKIRDGMFLSVAKEETYVDQVGFRTTYEICLLDYRRIVAFDGWHGPGDYYGIDVVKDADDWITDYELSWVPIAEISKMKPLPKLSGYGRKRLRAYRNSHKPQPPRAPRRGKTSSILAFGEYKSAYAWSLDPRANASDRAIKTRIKAGWDAEAAICTEPIRGPKGT